MLLSICGEMIRTLRPEKLARDVESFTADYHDLLTVEQLLSHGAGQATKEVPFAIDNNLSTAVDTGQLPIVGCHLYARPSSRFRHGVV
jgi:hypothetical protein